MVAAAKGFVILTMYLPSESHVSWDDARIVPRDSQVQWAIQCTWSTGTTEFATRAGKFT